MSFIKTIFNFYISSNIHVAFAIFCLTKVTLLGFDINENAIPIFNFFATILVYNFIRFYQTHNFNFKIRDLLKSKNRILILLNVFSFIFLVYNTLKIRIEGIIFLLPFVLAAIFYIVPLNSNKRNLRSIASLKLFLIAFTCAGVTVLFPIVHYDFQLSNDIWIIFFQRFLLIIAITIPFDIRDVNFDIPELRTLPQTIGIKNSKILGSVAILFFFTLGFLIIPIDKNTIVLNFIISIISFLFLILSTKHQNKYYSSFWVESIPIFWFLLVMIF